LTEPAVKTVDRVARIMRVMAHDAPDGWKLADISRETGFGKATTHRLIGALVDVGFLYQDDASRRYRLGINAARIGEAARQQELAHRARPVLARLAAATEDTVFASLREGSSAVCVARAVGPFPIRTLTLEEGDRRPLGVGAGSLALLAALPDEAVERAIGRNAAWLADYPGFDAAVLRSLVARTRRDGYALNEGRIVSGMAAVGVPVLDTEGRPLAALSLAAIAERVGGGRLPGLLADLRREAALLAAALTGATAGDTVSCSREESPAP